MREKLSIKCAVTVVSTSVFYSLFFCVCESQKYLRNLISLGAEAIINLCLNAPPLTHILLTGDCRPFKLVQLWQAAAKLNSGTSKCNLLFSHLCIDHNKNNVLTLIAPEFSLVTTRYNCPILTITLLLPLFFSLFVSLLLLLLLILSLDILAHKGLAHHLHHGLGLRVLGTKEEYQ